MQMKCAAFSATAFIVLGVDGAFGDLGAAKQFFLGFGDDGFPLHDRLQMLKVCFPIVLTQLDMHHPYFLKYGIATKFYCFFYVANLPSIACHIAALHRLIEPSISYELFAFYNRLHWLIMPRLLPQTMGVMPKG